MPEPSEMISAVGPKFRLVRVLRSPTTAANLINSRIDYGQALSAIELLNELRRSRGSSLKRKTLFLRKFTNVWMVVFSLTYVQYTDVTQCFIFE